MKKFLRPLLIVIILVLAFFLIKEKTTRLQFSQVQTGTTLANPASIYCQQNSGTLEIVTDLSGGQSGLCHLSDGTTCEEWAYMRGECSIAVTGITGPIENSNTGDINNVVQLKTRPISVSIPKNWSVVEKSLSRFGTTLELKISTDIVDNAGYSVSLACSLSKNNKTTVSAINNKTITVNPDNTFMEEGAPSNFYGIMVNTNIYSLGCEGKSSQPAPKNANEDWTPSMPFNQIEASMKSIVKTIKEL